MNVGRDHAKVSVVDLFCGAGGLSYGLKSCGFSLAAGIDIDEACRFPYEANNEAPFVRRDAATVSAGDIQRLFIPGSIRILVGCAPCQPFSTYSQKSKDPNWRLLDTFGTLIRKVGPEIVSMENVPRLVRFRGGETFQSFIHLLRRARYHVSWDVLYGPEFGLAQTRSRLVLLASKLGAIALPKPTHKGRYRSVRDEIGNLPPLRHGEADRSDPLHCASRLSELNFRRITAARPGGTWREWDPRMVASCHKAPTGKGYSAVYGRMKWDEPAPTITTQFFGFGNGRFGHPEQDRALSLREGALLQGFPVSYELVPPGDPIHFGKVGRLIGNAVPVRLATAIARAVRNHIKKAG